MQPDMVLVINFAGELGRKIARTIRNAGVYSEVLPRSTKADRIKGMNPKGVIIVANKDSRDGQDQEKYYKQIFNLAIPTRVMNIFDKEEVEEFIFTECSCQKNWTMSAFIKNSIEDIKDKVGDKKVICALSGGVDSSVAAVLMHKAVGHQLTCIFVDHGFMRENEGDEVENLFKDKLQLNLIRVNAEDRFLCLLEGITDPETKRKIIGKEFIRVFEEGAKKIGQIDYLVQGTIYPDIIESGEDDAHLIKSHHNVGGLPEEIGFQGIIEPLRNLFKDEVRRVGLELGIPDFMVERQPFPGPGLAIRIIGDITKEKLTKLKRADAIYREEIALAGFDKKIWQYFAVLTDIKSVGVSSGKRTYEHTLALRAVNSVDGMSANWVRIPYDILEKISHRITYEVPGINRVVYDISNKPPATIEWE